ncbi:hypothetical protein FLA_2652 [Filimonas lacunae]|nr:hypothetical protein FLA_2652 [Filimonas lacunae]
MSRLVIAAFLLPAMLTTSCKKDSVDTGTDPDTATSDTVFYKLYRVENFVATTVDDPNNAASTVLFSLENKAQVTSSYAKTNRWDIAFGGLYNSFLSGNNGAASANYGYGASGKGGILVLDKAFDDVINIPADAQFKTTKDIIGTDDAGDYGAGMGWYLYDFGGTRVRSGAYDDQHVAYALGDSLTLVNGSKINPRTVVVKTAKGHYAKIKMISCYKDLYTQADWHRDAPHMYFTFEYIIVPAGSTKFEIK